MTPVYKQKSFSCIQFVCVIEIIHNMFTSMPGKFIKVAVFNSTASTAGNVRLNSAGMHAYIKPS